MNPITGVEQVLAAMKAGQQGALEGAELGMKKGALHLIARAKALAPEDTKNLVMSIHSDGQVEKSRDYWIIRVGALAIAAGTEENYGEKTHENMEYDGPNVGGSRTQHRGCDTLAKGQSKVESSDGSAGGKYMERPVRNKTEVYATIIIACVRAKLEQGTTIEGGVV